jgi:uncharacterized phage infection (PIP) family protein YhgE
MTRRFACSLAVLSVGLLLVGGCGGSSDSKNFTKDYRTLRKDLKGVGNELATALRGASAPGQTDLTLAKTFDSLADKTQAVLDRLRKLKPPDKLKSDYDQLTSALAKAQKDVKGLASGLKAHDVSAARSTTQALLRDSPAVTKHADAIEAKLK